MAESLEDKIEKTCVAEKKHSDWYYVNKEILVGNITAAIGGFAAGLASSYITDSKEGLSIAGTVGTALGFQAGYVFCAHIDRKNDYKRRIDFWKYIVKFNAIVNIIGGVFGHTAHTAGIYWLQHVNISPAWAAVIAHFPAIIVGSGVSNIVGYLTGMIKTAQRS
jgi:heme O synthase-like polyprenyltransferase